MSDEPKPQFGEPWKYCASEIRSESLGVIMSRAVDDDETTVVCDDETMQRIVACVNFCQGVPTELLQRRAEGEFQFVNDRPSAIVVIPVEPLQSRPSFVMK